MSNLHHKYSPSSAYTYLNCLGQINLKEKLLNDNLIELDKNNLAAMYGTLAHSISEHILTNFVNLLNLNDDEFYLSVRDNLNFFFTEFKHQVKEKLELEIDIDDLEKEVIINHCLNYCRYLGEIAKENNLDLEKDGKVEYKLDLSHLIDGCFGTADFVLFNEKLQKIVVVDLKYGRYKVKAHANKQGLLYCSGAYDKFNNDDNSIINFEFHIYQPRANNYARFEFDIDYLEQFEDNFKQLYHITKLNTAPRIYGEQQCKFCQCKKHCPEFIKGMGGDLKVVKKLKLKKIDHLKIARDLFAKKAMFDNFIDDMKKDLIERIENKEIVPGFEITYRKARRKIDPNMIDVLFDKVGEDIYKKEIKSITDLKKTLKLNLGLKTKECDEFLNKFTLDQNKIKSLTLSD